MCDVNKMTFFRPWNRSDNIKTDQISTTQEQMNVQIDVKCEHEVDGESVILSFNSSDNCSESITQSASSSETSVCSCSMNSEDVVEENSLSILSDFVYNTRPERLLTNNSGRSYSTNESPCHSLSSVQYSFQSAFVPTYQFPLYSFGYHTPLNAGFIPVDESISYFGRFLPQTIYCGLQNLSRKSHFVIEDAVKYIRQQDAVAKQIKKLRPKKFRCEHCYVAFSNNGQLKGHVRIHTGERPFKCDAEGCNKSFTRNEELTRHKRIHTGSRPYSCIICGKRFGRKDHLKKHSRTHDNRSPYYISAIATPGSFSLRHSESSYMYPV